MSELLPCPFCGGAAWTEHRQWVSMDFWEIRTNCNERCINYGIEPEFNTEAEAISAWNTRHERECHITDYRGGYGMCDHCGAWVYGVAWTDCTENHKVWHCPNCGREIVR